MGINCSLLLRRGCLAVCGTVLFASPAFAVFFDLRGLSPSSSLNYNLTAGGITASLNTSSAVMKSGATTFGIDSTSANDNPNLIDGGGGSAESFTFLFGQTVLFESIQISQFETGDAGTFNVQGGSRITLHDGLNAVNQYAGGSGGNVLQWAGDTATGGTRGFSVDGFSVRLAGTSPAQAGDYNNNARVDAADYVLWRNTQGWSVVPYSYSDGGGNGTIDGEDYAPWRAHFGQGTGVAAAGLAAVPEPSELVLLLTALCVGCARRSNRE